MDNQGIAKTYQLECLLQKARNESFACLFISSGRPDARGEISIMAGFGISQQFPDLISVPKSPTTPIMGYVGYDFKNQIESSDIGFHLHLANVSVQGDNAVREITQAISRLGQREDLDAIHQQLQGIIRGGR